MLLSYDPDKLNKIFSYIKIYIQNNSKINYLKKQQLKIINNFYMTDIVTRNSQIMAECSLFLNNKTNFIKNNK